MVLNVDNHNLIQTSKFPCFGNSVPLPEYFVGNSPKSFSKYKSACNSKQILLGDKVILLTKNSRVEFSVNNREDTCAKLPDFES